MGHKVRDFDKLIQIPNEKFPFHVRVTMIQKSSNFLPVNEAIVTRCLRVKPGRET